MVRTPTLPASAPLLGLIALLVVSGCGTAEKDEGPNVAPSRCTAPEGVDSNPATIADSVKLINALLSQADGPVTLPCFLESLQRPLRLNGTRSRLSAQPAVGVENPRLFVMTQDMWLSVVPQGSGRPFLEFGQLTAPDRSIKGEIEFPVHDRLSEASPFERLSYAAITTCGVCHSNEVPALGIPHAVESKAFRPAPNTIVPVAAIREQYETCNAAADPERCDIFEAVFGHGDVEEHLFSEDMPTIFKPGP